MTEAPPKPKLIRRCAGCIRREEWIKEQAAKVKKKFTRKVR